jgi:hypothetical protein
MTHSEVRGRVSALSKELALKVLLRQVAEICLAQAKEATSL